MNFKRVLVLVMTFAMLMSTFAPTLGVFAAEVNGDEHRHELTDGKLNYVSIGDSMANGYGFDGYCQGNDGFNIIDNQDKVYGAGAYPLQFEEYLKGIYGAENVEHTKLAASALRAEDLLYLLGGRENPADDWFDQVNHYTGIDDNELLAAFYQEAVKNADVITLGVGNASFGAFFLSRVTSLLGVMGGSLDEEQKEMYTLENALSIVEDEDAKAKILEIYNNAFEALNSYVSAEIAEQYNFEGVCELLAYVAAGFMVNYAKAIDKIVELNESENLEIVLVGLMNTTYGMEITVSDDFSIDFGGIMDDAFEVLNAYIAAYPTVMYNQQDDEVLESYYVNTKTGEIKSELTWDEHFAGMFELYDKTWEYVEVTEEAVKVPTFYYAAQPQPKFIVQAFDDLAAAGWTNIDCGDDDCGTEGHDCEGEGRLSADIVRARTIKTYNSTIRVMIANAMFADDVAKYGVDNVLPKVTLEHVNAWKSWEELRDANGIPEGSEYDAPVNAYGLMHNNSALTTSVALYLGLEDAIVESIKVEAIPVSGLQAIADMEQLMAIMTGLGDVSASPYTIREGLASHLCKDSILPLVKIYAIFNIGDGMCVHPTPAGHDDLADEIINAYETKWTAEKQTLKNALEFVKEYYDEAYEYGYAYADKEGYIDVAAEAVKEAIEAIKVAIAEVESGVLGTTDELTEKLVAELNATLETLEELYEVLVNDSAADVEGLVAAVLALEDDLYRHLGNIYEVLAQAGIDVNQLVLLPALKEAIRIMNEEVIPSVVAAAEAFTAAAIEFMQEALAHLNSELLGLSEEVYNQIVAVLTWVMLHVEEKTEEIYGEIVDAFFALVDAFEEIYGNVEDALKAASEALVAIINKLDAKLSGAVSAVLGKISAACAELLERLYDTYGNVEDAVNALLNVLEYVIDTVVSTGASVEEVIEGAVRAFNYIFNAVAGMYNTVEEMLDTAKTIFDYIVNTVEKIDATIEKVAAAYASLVETLYEIYGNVEEALKVANEALEYVVELAEKIGAYADEIFAAYNTVVETLVGVYGAVEDVLEMANGIFNEIVETVVRVNGYVEGAIEKAVEIYTTVVKILANTCANIENVIIVASQLFGYLYDFAVEIVDPESIVELFKNLVEVVVESYGETRDAYYVVSQIYAYLSELNLEGFNDLVNGALNGSYELTDNSAYVALGNAAYADELAGMLNLTSKYNKLALTADYAEKVAAADLITIKVDNGETYEFLMGQLDKIYTLEPLDWSKHLDAEGQAALKAVLAALKADLIATGAIDSLLAEIDGVGLETEVVASVLIYAFENTLYAYAEFVDRLTTVLDDVTVMAPNATVVLTAVGNPLNAWGIDLSGADEYMAVVDGMIGAINAQLFAAALAYDNVIYVNSNEAEDIYDALNVHCDHVYDDCEDTECNRCLADRVAPGHSFVEYVSNNDATCSKNGTETAKCENCDATDTREVANSKKAHTYDNACDADCNVCGEKRTPADHVFGEWEVVTQPTKDSEGLEERVCSVCGYKETNKLPPIEPKIGKILAIVIGSVVIASGAGVALYFFVFKKKA